MEKPLNVCGPQIRRLRSALGWSQPVLAAKCQIAGWDISRDVIANIEVRRRTLSDLELSILARVLKVPLDSLFPKYLRALHPSK